jgi:hypothetical protein
VEELGEQHRARQAIGRSDDQTPRLPRADHVESSPQARPSIRIRRHVTRHLAVNELAVVTVEINTACHVRDVLICEAF